MTVKGKFSKNRNPTIKIDGVNVKFTSQVKYLGVILDEKMSFVEHAKHVRNKLLNFIMAIKRIANQEWGMKHYSKKILYNGGNSYSNVAAVWFYRTNHTHLQRHLNTTQCSLLLLFMGATSTAAMQVIAQVAPLDLVVVKKGLKSLVRRNMSAKWSTYQFDSKTVQEEVDLDLEYSKRDAEIRSIWQTRRN